MTLKIQLLGDPRIEGPADTYVIRSRKSWCVLAYLLLSTRPVPRRELASLLFDGASDPLGALRWSLAEIRKALDGHGTIDGDPLELTLSPDVEVDLYVVKAAPATVSARLPGVARQLLDGASPQGAPLFETWLVAQQRRLWAACTSVLHEAALFAVARGEVAEALDFAGRVCTMEPLAENNHALMVRIHRLAGDQVGADRQYRVARELLDAEIGRVPHRTLDAALSQPLPRDHADASDVLAVVEAGRAAMGVGAIDAGLDSLRAAVALADRTGVPDLRSETRLELAMALVHSVRGLDEHALVALYEANELALAEGDHARSARAMSEIGYVDFLRARYDRARRWLDTALNTVELPATLRAKCLVYLGSVASDVGELDTAQTLLADAARLASELGEHRRQVYAESMLGRVALLRGELGEAGALLDSAVQHAERDQWLAFVPWPQALRSDVALLAGDVEMARTMAVQATARARHLGDPCWEGIAGRSSAMVAAASGRVDEAFTLLDAARLRCRRLADVYVWVEAYILDAQCQLAAAHGHPGGAAWRTALLELADSTAMAEFARRARAYER